MKKSCILFVAIFAMFLGYAQEIPIDYNFGEKYNDRYKYSNLVTIADDGTGGYILVRSYFTGLILKPKGYFIEHYSKELQLLNEYNYKLKGPEFVEGYVKNGQLYLLFLDYDLLRETYNYVVHRSPISEFNFTSETILSVPSKPVNNPLDKNYYNRNFSSGFTTTALFNEEKSAFVISTHFKKGKTNKHHIHLFNASLKKIFEHDFSVEVEEKNYAFENIEISADLSKAYIVGKAYFKKKRFSALERKFQYELIAVSARGSKIQTFDGPGKYSEGLKPILHKDRLVCVGFYADRKDNRYNGIAYFDLDPSSLQLKTKKYNPFSTQFMFDKFGKENAEHVKNLIFKNVSFTGAGDLLFNAEEYFVTNSIQANSSGGRVMVERFHHNDIVSVKLDANGNLAWARNINKSEVTQGDGAYASYSSCTKAGKTYFFISTSAENPQLLNNERMVFKQGLSRNRNVFVIQLDEAGKMSYEKIIDDKEARLPLMVSKPLMDSDAVIFYAKRGTKKQLVNLAIN
ncbi:hypothetical protein [Poritiphilus flavus]|uniref:Uncharacterized protein n=1 Tax=Poritiphilus flavus TaxID=2697053 RepID=A0A6L9E872_9FLAO|nr:hypothetical protein [Poritiphilus flavus]NAS10844.1 hypothetical protein [Poritiphilus flavus]